MTPWSSVGPFLNVLSILHQTEGLRTLLTQACFCVLNSISCIVLKRFALRFSLFLVKTPLRAYLACEHFRECINTLAITVRRCPSQVALRGRQDPLPPGRRSAQARRARACAPRHEANQRRGSPAPPTQPLSRLALKPRASRETLRSHARCRGRRSERASRGPLEEDGGGVARHPGGN